MSDANNQPARQGLLKTTLRLNGAFSLACAIDLLLFSEPLARWMGGLPAVYLELLGGGLIGFAALVFFVSERSLPGLTLARQIILMDKAWIIASLLVMALAHHWFSAIGLALIALVALIVAGFVHYQSRGIAQLQAAA